MTFTTITIRPATPNDAASLAFLITQLGYATTPAEMRHRMEAIAVHPDYQTWLACCGEKVVGMVGASRNLFYEQNGMYVRVAALVTDASFRQQGVGSTLLATAEQWARTIGATAVVLNCGNRAERAAAHAFYARLGFVAKSTGYFKKIISAQGCP